MDWRAEGIRSSALEFVAYSSICLRVIVGRPCRGSEQPRWAHQAVWVRITARDRYSVRCWGEPLGIAMKGVADRVGRRWAGAMTPDACGKG
jgi:hypothetical protein